MLHHSGGRDTPIVTSDDLPGIEEAVAGVFPEATYQGCVVHVVRNSLKYVSYKDRKSIAGLMRSIYQSPNEESALGALESLEQAWGEQYRPAIRTWERS